jgi:hypothetical protein
MENYLILKVVISFVAAGIWIGGATLLAERLGSKKGGLISNLPSTILIALIFVALVNDTRFTAEATDAVPMGMLIDTLFLFMFIILLKGGLLKTIFISLSAWFVLAFLARQIHSSNIRLNIVLYLLTAMITYMVLEYKFNIPAKEKSQKKFSAGSILLRALFAGSVVAGTTLISTVAGTYWVGLFSTFPAVMLSTMVILTLNQAPEFARAVGKVMILSSTNIIVYALGVNLTYPALGMAMGTIVSFLLSFIWILLMHPLIRKLSR